MSDFMREVDEDYRRERVTKFLSRFQVPLILLIVLIIVGAGVWRWWQDSQVTAAQQENTRFTAAVGLAKAGKDAEAQASFAAIAKDGPAGYAMLAGMRAAQLHAKSDPEVAAKDYDAIADEGTLPESLRDTARMRGALLRVDRDDPKAFEARYGRYAQPGFAFHNSMRELLALMALKRGDSGAAGRYLDEISVDPGAPSAMRNRAEAFRLLATSGAATPSTTQAPPADVTPLAPPADAAPATPAPATPALAAPAAPPTPPAAPH